MPSKIVVAACCFGFLLAGGNAWAQEKGIALKNGETAELGTTYWVSTSDCRSLLTKFNGIDVLEGPPGVSVTIREEMVRPRPKSCTKTVPGGMILVKADEVKEPWKGKLTFRINYKLKDGDRQSSRTYNLSLYP